jgi:hypothetical protein
MKRQISGYIPRSAGPCPGVWGWPEKALKGAAIVHTKEISRYLLK